MRIAAERAVERVLGSEEAFAVLVRRLEEAGWHVERAPEQPAAPRPRASRASAATSDALTPPARAR